MSPLGHKPSRVEVRAVAPIVVLLALACVVLASYIVVTTLMHIVQNGFPLPWWDEWETVLDVEKLYQGRLGLRDLWAQHNEHRLLFPRLVFLADYLALSGTQWLTLACSLTLQALTASLLAAAALAQGLAPWPVAAVVVSLILGTLFSSLQYDNLQWGFQIQFTLVYAATAAAFVLLWRARERLSSGRQSGWWVAGAFLSASVATYAMANGVVTWGVLLLLAWWLGLPRRHLVALTVSGALVVGSYLVGYQGNPYHGTLGGALAHPLEAAEFFLLYLGNPWLGSPAVSGVLGGFGVVATCLAFWNAARSRGRMPARGVMLGMLCFVIVTAVITSVGRYNFGNEAARSSRYLTPVLLFWLSLVLLAIGAPARVAADRPWMASAGGFAVLAYLALHQWNPAVEGWLSARWTKQMSALALYTGVRDNAVLAGIYTSVPEIVRRSEMLRAHRLAFFSWDLPEVGARLAATTVAGAAECVGHFDVVEAIASTGGGAGFIVVGWGWDRRAQRPLTRVAIVDGSRTVVGVALGGLSRPDVSRAMPEVNGGTVGWRGYARGGPGTLRALGLLEDRTGYCDLGQLLPPGSPLPGS